MSKDYDVIIIGAGAAGLAAARVFHHHGLTVKVLESSSKIGGRAQAAKTSRKDIHGKDIVPMNFDAGAHWLHYGKLNVYIEYAQRSTNTFDVFEAPDKYVVFDCQQGDTKNPSHNLYPHACDLLKRANNLENEIELAGLYQSLISLYDSAVDSDEINRDLDTDSSYVSPPDPYYGGFALLHGNFDMGKDWDKFSTNEYLNTPSYKEGYKDYLCAQGYGKLVESAAQHLITEGLIQLNSWVKEVVADEENVKVKVNVRGNDKSYLAKYCLVTCSAGVLGAKPELITFQYKKFQKKINTQLKGYRNLKMGCLFRVVLRFSEDIFKDFQKSKSSSKAETQYIFTLPEVEKENAGKVSEIIYVTHNSERMMSNQDEIGTNFIVFAEFGGTHARCVTTRKTLDQIKKTILKDIEKKLGKDVKQLLVSIDQTYWGSINYKGCFASDYNLNPMIQNRSDISENFDLFEGKRILFTGEAHSCREWGTVSGAHKVACKIAKDVIRKNYKDLRLSKGILDMLKEDSCDTDECSGGEQEQQQCAYFPEA